MAKRPTRSTVTVQKVIDGDTIKTTDGEIVRLARIDAPEKGHAGADMARKALRKKIGGKKIRLNRKATGPYGRTIGELQDSSNRSVNKAMKDELEKIQSGIARRRAATQRKIARSRSKPKRPARRR